MDNNAAVEKYLKNISRTATLVRVAVWVGLLVVLFFAWERRLSEEDRATLNRRIDQLEQGALNQVDRLRGQVDRMRSK